MYAVVDIETTGGYASQNCITEIAIILYNGYEVEGKYQTLVNPEKPIQPYVQSMTGITNAMVAKAPKFEDVASHIYNLLQDRIFVAHNVNFDYSFVKQHLKTAGYEIDLPKICTVKMSRKIFPGLPKYGLGSLSNHFNIKNVARHRAIGDATATTELLTLLLRNDKNGEIAKLAKRRNASQYLPPNLKFNIIQQLPSLPGVYYFHNKKDKIIYVGKAINLKKRVSSHFSNNKSTKQKQDFLKDIYNISWKECSSDLTASIFESIEIKRLWPIYNKSQKHYVKQYGIFVFEDSKGYQRLAIDNKKKILQPLICFQLIVEARQFLNSLCTLHNIHPYLFFLSKEAPEQLDKKQVHNKKISLITKQLEASQQSYLIHDGAKNYLLIEDGIFCAMGKIDNISSIIEKHKKQKPIINSLKDIMMPYPENLTIKSLITNFINNHPEMLIPL